MPTEQPSHSLKEQILPAILEALILSIVRFFTIPWRIWTGAAFRLAAARRSAKNSESLHQSEFPVLEWFRSAWDALIFLSWFAGALIAIITFLGNISALGFFNALAAAIAILIYSYFSVILMSLLKESLILILSIALNVETLAKKKDH